MKIFLGLAFVIAFSFLFYINFFSLGSSNEEVGNTPESRAIRSTITGDILIKPAVWDYQVQGEYMYGYRFPSQIVKCDQGKFSYVMLKLNPVYFILNQNNESLKEFTSKGDFVKSMESQNLTYSKLDFDLIDDTSKFYNKKYQDLEYYKLCDSEGKELKY